MKKVKAASIIIPIAIMIMLIGGFYILQQKQVAPVTVYQYARDLKQTSTTTISSSDITSVTIPKDGVTANMILDPNQIIGKSITTDVYKGNYINTQELANAEDIDVFKTMDLSTYRKIAITVNRQEAVGGNLKAGDSVDLTYVGVGTSTEKTTAGTSNKDFTYSKTFMENVLVYKILTDKGVEYVDQTDGPVYDANGNPVESTPSVIILAVTTAQEEEITARMATGKVKIIGRFDESKDTKSTGFIMGQYGDIFTFFANPEK